MTPDAHIETGGAQLARRFVEPICAMYTQVFSVPPFAWDDEEPDRHRERLTQLLVEPSFGVAVATLADKLVGFAYGLTMPATTKWWSGFVEPVPTDITNEWEGRTFALIDLAVQEQQRGQGIGRRLIEALVATRREERATLSVEPAATDTQAFYVHLGWEKVGRKRLSPGAFTSLVDVFVLPLSG